MNLFKKPFLSFLFTAFLIFLLGSFVFVEAKDLEIEYPEIGGYRPEDISTTLPDYIKYLFNFAILIIGIVAFGSLIYGGVLYMSSAGDPRKRKNAENQILAGFLGIAILLGSYFILTTINPQLVILKEPETKPVEIIPAEEFKLPEIITSINVELPIETRVKGVKAEAFGMFEKKRLERIENNATTTAETAIESKNLGWELHALAGKCKCEHGTPCNQPEICNGYTCSYPICQGSCVWEEVATDTYECVNRDCGGICCTSDPCCCQRKDIDANKAKNRENIKEFQDLKEKLYIEKIELQIEIDKLKKTLEVMKDDCPLSGILSRDNFNSLKDYYIQHAWKLKKIRYFDEIQYLIATSTADFYCPIGGTRLGYVPPEIEIPFEALATSVLEFEEYASSAGEFEVTISCSRPIPFGEIIDKGLVIANKLLKKMYNESDKREERGLIQLQFDIIEAIDKLHLAVNKCLSSNCAPVCDCCPPCECGPFYCTGKPCPMGEIKKAAEEIEAIQKEIEKRKDEIVDIVKTGIKTEDNAGNVVSDTRGEIQKYLEDEFDRMAERFHYCIAVPEEVKPGWFILNCERSMGAIGPDGIILGSKKEMEDCKCDASHMFGLLQMLIGKPECLKAEKKAENFPELKDYECKQIDKCYEYNFFCCRIKE